MHRGCTLQIGCSVHARVIAVCISTGERGVTCSASPCTTTACRNCGTSATHIFCCCHPTDDTHTWFAIGIHAVYPTLQSLQFHMLCAYSHILLWKFEASAHVCIYCCAHSWSNIHIANNKIWGLLVLYHQVIAISEVRLPPFPVVVVHVRENL